MRRGRVRWSWLAACFAVSAAVTPLAHADGMRCGTTLVTDGDTTYDVGNRCGKPDFASQHTELRTVRNWVAGPCFNRNGVVQCGSVIESTVQVVVDDWIYDFGPTEFVRYLRFEQGYLLAITTGKYGTVK